MGRPTEAARILARVVDAEPANQAALELLARSYFGSAQFTRAEEALTRLVELAPANGWARRALAPWSGRAGTTRRWRTTAWPTPSAPTDLPPSVVDRPTRGLDSGPVNRALVVLT